MDSFIGMAGSRTPIGVALLGLGLVLGCARVDVRKIPARGSYTQWDDERQRQSDSIQGIRYYMPRPYLAVSDAFVVGGGDFYVTGTLDPKENVVRVSTNRLPEYLKRHFATDESCGKSFVPAEAIRVKRVDSSDGVRRAAAQAAEGGEATAAPAGEKKYAVGDAVIAGRCTPPIATAKTSTILLSVTLKKDAKLKEISAAQCCLIPLEKDGSPNPSKTIAINVDASPTSVPFDPGSKDGVYEARVRPSDLIGCEFYAAGLRLQAVETGTGAAAAQVPILYYSSDAVLSAGNLGKKADAPKKDKETTSEEEPAKSTAAFAASGNPQTDPLVKVNKTFDVLYLPDFDEQYAVNVSAGLGTAKSKIALENGWLLESTETAIDNREVGKFVFKQIEKFTDIAAAVLKSELLPVASAADLASDATAAEMAASHADGGGAAPLRTLLLRVSYVLVASPGMYPILKPGEVAQWKRLHAQECLPGAPNCTCRPDDSVYVPCPPYTVVAKDVYRRVSITLVGVTSSQEPPNGDSVDVSDDLAGLFGDAETKARIEKIEGGAKLISDFKSAKFFPKKGTLQIELKKSSTLTPAEQSALQANLAGALGGTIRDMPIRNVAVNRSLT